MRTAILLAAILLATAINPELEYSKLVINVYGTAILIGFIMDLVEFFGELLLGGKNK